MATSTIYDSFTSSGVVATKTLDVTKHVQDIANDSITSYGLMMRATDETSSGKYVQLANSRYATASKRPKLTVVHYDPPATPTISTNYTYMKKGTTMTASWSGLTSRSLNRVEYRVAKWDPVNGVELGNLVDYSSATKIGTTESGSATITDSKNWPEGVYKFVIRGVDNGGIKGTGKGKIIYIDGTAPVLSSASLTPVTSLENYSYVTTPELSWSVSDTYLSAIKYSATNNGKLVTEGTIEASGSGGVGGKSTIGGPLPSGINIIKVWAVDKAGNKSAEKTFYYYMDAVKPTGKLKINGVQAASSQTVKGTLNLDIEINDTPSGVKNAKLLLLDPSMTKVENTLISNVTQSITTSFDTTTKVNGLYVLELTVTDKAGNKITETATIGIENKIDAPDVSEYTGKDGNAVCEWSFNSPQKNLKELEYQLPDSETWTKIANSATQTGRSNITIPDTEGTYEIKFRAIDTFGTPGDVSTAIFVVDKTKPIVEKESFKQGVINGTVKDAHIDEWKVTIKAKGSMAAETVLNTQRENYENETLASVDLSNDQSYPAGTWYVVTITAVDKAGNQSVETFSVYKGASVPADEPAYVIQAPDGMEQETIWTLGGNEEFKLQKTEHASIDLEPDTIEWYLNGVKEKQENSITYEGDFTNGEKYPENKNNTILAVVKGNDGNYYPTGKTSSKSYTEQTNLQAAGTHMLTELYFSEQIYEFTFQPVQDTASGGTVAYKMRTEDGEWKTLESGKTYRGTDVHDKITLESLEIQAVISGSASVSGYTLQYKVVKEQDFMVSLFEQYRPRNVSVQNKLDYKTHIRWELTAKDENNESILPKIINEVAAAAEDGTKVGKIYYELYRGTEKDFTADDDHLIDNSIETNYWSSIEVDSRKTIKQYYYKLRAVEKDGEGNITRKSHFSSIATDEGVAENEYTKRLGYQEYWGYTDFDTPNGNGAVELSQGNFYYSQEDISLPNAQLEFGLTRHYNSQSTVKSAFGVGWDHNYNLELLKLLEGDEKNLIFKDGTGTIYRFAPKDGEVYYSNANEYVTLTINKGGKTEKEKVKVISGEEEQEIELEYVYTMKMKNGMKYLFDHIGRIVYQEEPNGTFLLFAYDDQRGFLRTVMTEKGRTIEFTYQNDEEKDETGADKDCALVEQVKLPDGTTLNYSYVNTDTTGKDWVYRLASMTKTGEEKGETKSTVYEYEYNSYSMLSSIADAKGNTYEIAYVLSSEGNLTKAKILTNPIGEKLELDYSVNTSETSTTKKIPDGTVLYTTSVVYDGQGYITEETDAEGNKLTRKFKDGVVTDVITKETSMVSVHSYNADTGRVEFSTQDKEETTLYGERENVTTQTDQLGNVAGYTYADDGTTLANQDLPITETETGYDDLLLSDFDYEYDDYGNEIFSFDDIMDEETYSTYDDDGNLTDEVSYIYNDGGSTKTKVSENTYEYNPDGTVKSETSATPESSSTTENTYDSMGRLLTSTVKYGDITEVTSFTYDYMGRETKSITKITKGSDEKTEATVKTYDANGTLLTETAKDGTVTEYAYDALNRVISRVVSKGSLSRTYTTEYGYEKNLTISQGGDRTKTIPVAYKEVQKQGSKTISTTYKDGAGKTVREISAGITTDYIYDTLGSQIGTVTAGKLTIQVSDSAGNVTEVIENPEVRQENGETVYYAGADSVVTSNRYNSRGDVTETTDGMGTTTVYTYDEEGRLKNVSIKDGKTLGSYTYTTTDGATTTTLTDVGGKKGITVTDAEGRETSVTDKSGDGSSSIQTTYTYDFNGNLSKTAYADGSYLEHTYDAKGRTTQVKRYDKNKALEGRTVYTYDDATDAVLTMVDYQTENGTETPLRYTGYTYDDFGRTISYTEVDGTASPTDTQKTAGKVTYTYNSEDQLTEITYPESGDEVKGLLFTYDANGWPLQVKVKYASSEELLREYTYNTDGTVKSMKDHTGSGSNYILKEYTYDALNRVTAMTATKNGDASGKLESYAYTYDKNSNILTETLVNNTPSTKTEKVDETRTHTYDNLGRLLKTVYTDRVNTADSKTVSYTYDDAGNRRTRSVGGETTAYTYNGLHQLTKAVTAGTNGEISNKTYTYDAKGNELTETDSITNTSLIYAYDAESQLLRATLKNGSTVVATQENWYNGNGQRIGKTEVASKNTASPVTDTMRYFYDGTTVLYTMDDAGNLTTKNFVGTADNAIATRRYEGSYADKNYFYLKDIRGTVTSIVDESMNGVASYEYDEFGITTVNGDEDFENQICYTGGIYDELTGLYYLNARYYDPETGRFLSEDTYRGKTNDFATWHLYVYCANNPVNYTDPSGHSARAVSAVAGAIVGVVVDVSLSAFLYFVSRKGTLKGYRYSAKDFVKAAFSGLVDGVLVSSNLKRNAMAVASGAKSAIISYINNRKKSLKKIMKSVVVDAAIGGLMGYIGGDGIGRKYWERSFLRKGKGSYVYKGVTIGYGSPIKVSSRNLAATRVVVKECAYSLAQGASLSVFVDGTKKLVKKCKKWLKK